MSGAWRTPLSAQLPGERSGHTARDLTQPELPCRRLDTRPRVSTVPNRPRTDYLPQIFASQGGLPGCF